LRGRQLDRDGCWNPVEPHAPYTWVGWGSRTIAADDPNGPSVVVVDENGFATAQAAGTAEVGADWSVVRWLELYECCEYQTDEAQPLETISVLGRVSKIQYQSGSTFNDISETLYVLKGTRVLFKAIPNPASFVWPSGKPVWGGTSGATGTGETTPVTFNTLSTSTSDFQTVTATYGNKVTVNVIVFDLSGVLTPDDNFSGRSTERFGVHEHITLSSTITPPGITASQIGGIQWAQTSGNGTLSNALTDGTASYDVPDSSGSATLQLKMVDGPSKDQGPITNITVLTPSGGSVQKFSGVRHFQNWWSCGFLGDVFVEPKEVSFLNLFFWKKI